MQVTSNHQQPTVAQLHDKDEVAFKHNSLLQLLNQPVHEKWVKTHDAISVKVNGQFQKLRYLPIDKVRFLLTRIFGLFWYDEIIRYSSEFNSCTVHVRLHYCIPETDVWLFKDGIGAVGVQTDKGSSASDLGAIKSNAVMLAMPAASSYALSNAAEKLGSLFGAHLNKSDAIAFAGMTDMNMPEPQTQAPPAQQPQTNGWHKQPEPQQPQNSWQQPTAPQPQYSAENFFSNL